MALYNPAWLRPNCFGKSWEQTAMCESCEHLDDCAEVFNAVDGGKVAETRPPHEADPTGRDPHEPGAKLDHGKPMGGLLADFSLALMAVAEVGTFGANKYSRGGWQTVPEAVTRYGDAKWRHLLKSRHESHDPESNLLHKAHEAWNVLAELELMLREKPEAN